ncbi:hypothetical protein GJ496_005784 [Pomphorhynchus laevis]|nr:hypothetical protein GJ496_005784 [Pomphorhynchus laevis]
MTTENGGIKSNEFLKNFIRCNIETISKNVEYVQALANDIQRKVERGVTLYQSIEDKISRKHDNFVSALEDQNRNLQHRNSELQSRGDRHQKLAISLGNVVESVISEFAEFLDKMAGSCSALIARTDAISNRFKYCLQNGVCLVQKRSTECGGTQTDISNTDLSFVFNEISRIDDHFANWPLPPAKQGRVNSACSIKESICVIYRSMNLMDQRYNVEICRSAVDKIVHSVSTELESEFCNRLLSDLNLLNATNRRLRTENNDLTTTLTKLAVEHAGIVSDLNYHNRVLQSTNKCLLNSISDFENNKNRCDHDGYIFVKDRNEMSVGVNTEHQRVETENHEQITDSCAADAAVAVKDPSESNNRNQTAANDFHRSDNKRVAFCNISNEYYEFDVDEQSSPSASLNDPAKKIAKLESSTLGVADNISDLAAIPHSTADPQGKNSDVISLDLRQIRQRICQQPSSHRHRHRHDNRKRQVMNKDQNT